LSEGLLDALHFGVPQRRPRVFVVGLNRKKFGNAKLIFPVGNTDNYRTVEAVLRGLKQPAFFERGLQPHEITGHENHWTMQPRSPKFKDGFLKEGQNLGRSFRVLSWSKPSWTVAYGHREIHIHPSGKRRLSVYEAMLLQGLPKTYILKGNLSEQVRQVSDTVPSQVAESLAMAIREFLTEHSTRNGERRSERHGAP